MAMIRYDPDSSNLDSVLFREDGFVEIEFRSGARYRSKTAVPKSVIVEWIAADSAGSFYHSRVKGVYELEKVQDEPSNWSTSKQAAEIVYGIQDNNASKSD